MLHERWRRLMTLWMREAGRTDPLFPKEGMWSCGNSIGEWGRATEHARSENKLFGEYRGRRAVLVARQKAELAEFDRKQAAHVTRFMRRAERDLSHRLHVELSPSGVIEFVDGANRVELLRFVGKRGDFIAERRTKKKGEHAATVLVNGDGFDSNLLQRLQAEIRRDVSRNFGALGTLVVPHQALTAAGIELSSIKRIAVTRDGGENVVVRVTGPDPKDLGKANQDARNKLTAAKRSDTYWNSPWHSYESRKQQFQLRVSMSNTRETVSHQMYRQPLDGVPSWQTISHSKELGWHTTEFRHRLGSTVFSAVDESGQRHRFISSFDSQETPPLYFLAQLPDEGSALTFTDALDLLAPPIVHEARKDGKFVFRQGDVFFVETDWTLEKLREQKAVIHMGMGRGVHSERPAEGRNIYRTGHLAEQVAVLPNGVTLALGTVTHFPAINDPVRTIPDHRPLALMPDKWFLCVRNQVPRSAATQDSAGAQPDDVTSTTEGGGTNASINVAA